MAYRDGTDLILGLVIGNTFFPLGHSTGCKISDTSETGERVTKEAVSGKWKEKYIKSLAESIQADGFVYDGDEEADKAGLPTLKDIWLSAEPITARYAYRGEENTKYYEGDFVITSLENDGQAGDDEKYSITLENCGAITPHESQGNDKPGINPGINSGNPGGSNNQQMEEYNGGGNTPQVPDGSDG